MNQIKENYIRYINSSAWENEKETINAIYKQNNWPINCIKCGSKSFLNLHHNYYSTYLNNQNVSDYDFLCLNCHKKWHSIQKGNNKLQNELTKLNLNFYISNKNLAEIEKIVWLLREKIAVDETIIKLFFSQKDITEYMEEKKKNGNILFYSFIISFFLLFFYGVGIITFLIILFFIKNKEIKPNHYDSFILRKNILEQKKVIINNTRDSKFL